MDALGIEKMTLHPRTGDEARREAADVAQQFEAVFVRTLVQSLRKTSSVGEEGGMFGSETGSDTYADWFDQNVADELGKNGGIGIADAVLIDMERHGEIGRDVEQLARMKRAAAKDSSIALGTRAHGGFNVLL